MLSYYKLWNVLCYDEGDKGDKGAGGDDGDKGDGDKGNKGDGDKGNKGDDGKKFTQEELNKILAEDKRKHQEKYSQLEDSYQELLENQNLDKDEREKLQGRLEDLQKSQRTKEQQAEYERKREAEKFETELKDALEGKTHWENLYKKETINRALQDAAVKEKAYNPTQIVSLLGSLTQLKDVEGDLKPMVDFPDIDAKTGEAIKTLRTPDDAVKRMKELPKIHGNLFESNVVSGVGYGNDNTANSKNIDYRNMTPEMYRKYRKEIKERVGR